MPARAQPSRNSTAQKATTAAAARRRNLARANAARKVKDVNSAKVKSAVHLRAAGERVAARSTRARVPRAARAAVPLPVLLGAVERMRARELGAAKRMRTDIEGAASDDGEGTHASLGRDLEEGEDMSVDVDMDPQAPPEGAGAGAPERPYKLLFKLKPHVLEPLRKCKYGCGAMVWPAEDKLCCSGGTHILGPIFNPPIDDEYWEFLKLPHVSADSRLLNGALAMGTQGVYPSRAMGGLGFHEQRYGHVSLMGKTYCVMYGLGANNAFDSYLLPNELLVDAAANDLGADYAQRLLRARTYFAEHHPLARHLCAIADVPGPKIDLNPYMRIEALSLRSSTLEKEEALVNYDLLRVEVKRLRDALSSKTEEVLGLENRAAQLELSMEGRKKEIEQARLLQRMEAKLAEEERHRLALDLGDRSAKISVLKVKYEMRCAKLRGGGEGEGGGEPLSQAAFIMRAAQKRELLQREGVRAEHAATGAAKRTSVLLTIPPSRMIQTSPCRSAPNGRGNGSTQRSSTHQITPARKQQ
jgi:hypothetical protein